MLRMLLSVVLVLASAVSTAMFISEYADTSGGERNISLAHDADPMRYDSRLAPGRAATLSLFVLGPVLALLLVNRGAGDFASFVAGWWSLLPALALLLAQWHVCLAGRRGVGPYGYGMTQRRLGVMQGTISVAWLTYVVVVALTIALLFLFWQMKNGLAAFLSTAMGAGLLLAMGVRHFADMALEIETGTRGGWWTLAAYGCLCIFAGIIGFTRRHG